MLKYFFVTLILTFSFSAQSIDLEKSCYSIHGMHCGSCKEKIESKLKEEPGIQDSEVSLKNEMGIVSFDKSLTSDEVIISKIKEVGYTGKKVKCLN